MSAMCLAIITLAALAVAPVISVSHDDAVHVGCFKTNLVDTQRSYYMVNEPLSWDNGFSACIRRYTTYVGVQADNRLPSKSYFYCGNDLLEHSDKLEDSACARCDGTDRPCGGPQSISIYKIRDSTPLVILIATESGITLMAVDGYTTYYSIQMKRPDNGNNDNIVQMIHLYSRDEIVFQGPYYKIYKYFFDQRIQQYSTLSTVEANSSGWGFTVDWLHETLYYCDQQRIMEYDMKSETTRILYTIKSSKCYDFAIDPYTRTLFAVFRNGTLSAFSLLTQSYRTYTGGKNGLYNALEVAVDCESQLIYVSTYPTEDLNTTYLVHLDYNLDNLTILHNDTELSRNWGLDVFNGTVFWAMSNSGHDWIYSCKPSPTCNHDNINSMLISDYGLRDIVIYHPVKQTPTERYLCSTARCTHGCSRRTLFTAQCTCPEGLSLGSDNTTCQEPSTFTMATMSSPADSSKNSTMNSDHGPKINLLITNSVVSLVLVSLLFMTIFFYLLRYHNRAYTVQPRIEFRTINHEH